eukprot:gene17959-52912_t
MLFDPTDYNFAYGYSKKCALSCAWHHQAAEHPIEQWETMPPKQQAWQDQLYKQVQTSAGIDSKAVAVLVGGDAMEEFIAPNRPRMEIRGLRSTPIGSPLLHECVQMINDLYSRLIAQREGLRLINNRLASFYVDSGPDDTDGSIGLRKDFSFTVKLTPGEFATQFQRGEALAPGERLDGRHFGSSCLDTMLAVGLEPSLVYNSVTVLAVGLEPSLVYNSVTVLAVGLEPSLVYNSVTEGHAFVAEFLPWVVWTPGDIGKEEAKDL